jgi:hypothetical protein
MDETTRANIKNIHSDDKNVQNKAYFDVIAATERPVDWAYEAWDGLVADLKHKDNHVRAIAAQVLSNLAKSDPEKRMLKDFDALLAVTKDERFVTARHCLQSLWKVGVAGEAQRQKYLDGLEQRFNECIAEKNTTMIRHDISQSLRNVYDATGDEKIREKALALIETEADAKYRKKYAGVWKKK